MATVEELCERAKAAVKAYKIDDSKAVANEAVATEGIDLVEVINKGYSAGITEVGALFEQKKLFLPHMMAAANAMTAGMDILVAEIEKHGGSVGNGLGSVVICSIEGDIHSIGKDIVAIMLKVGGFNVLNIGKDVPIKQIVASVKENNANYVATSALMTSTMVGQKTLEDLLREEGIRDSVKSNVGGAPVTQQWANEIGADIYSENAVDAVAKFTASAKC